MIPIDRRRFVRASVAGVAALAGCGAPGAGDGEGSPEPLPGEEYGAVDRWLTETEVGGEAGNYDGGIPDRRGADTVEVDVGAEGNGDHLAFAPPAVAVAPGATVRWTWTGEGGEHNVHAAPDEQIGESDFEFRSGDPTAEEGTEFAFTFEGTGNALYHCGPHLSVGMKGAVVVREEDGE